MYSALEEEDPTSIEAFFYAAYSKARSAMTDADLYRRQAAFKVLEKSIQLIPENFDIRKEKEQAVLLRKISADVLALDKVPFVYNERKNGNGKVLTSDKLETITMLNNLNAIMIKALAGVYEKYGEEKSKAIYLFECRLAHFDHLINVGRLGDPSRRLWVSGAQALHQSWNAIDPSHVIPQQEEPEEPPAEEGKKKKRRLSGVAIFFIIFGAIATVIGTIGMAVGFFYLLLS